MELTEELKAAGPAACGYSLRPRLRSGRRVLPPASPAAFFLMFLLFFGFIGAAVACPSCKAAGSSENPAAADKLTQGWARSIYLLMWTPYILFGGVTFAIVRSARRSKKP